MAKKLKVALIFGGTSEEREVSLASAKSILKNLDRKKYIVEQIEVARFDWITKAAKKISACDVALLALHGPGGEDGTVQGLLELLGTKYTGSGVLASALAMDKAKTKQLAASAGILVAPHIVVNKNRFGQRSPILENMGMFVVKPNRIGSSIGVTIVNSKKKLESALKTAFKQDDEVMIEEYIAGRELTVPVLGNVKLRALPVIEIKPKGGSKFFDYRAKYNPQFSDEIVPAIIPKALAKKLQEIAILVHQLLGCRGVSRSDFIVTSKNQIFFLEINTIPGMTSNSLVPKAAAAAGISYSQLLDKLITLGLNKE
jgi:D-alanine-D-alanine ligase